MTLLMTLVHLKTELTRPSYRVVQKSPDKFVRVRKQCTLFTRQVFIIKITYKNKEIVTLMADFTYEVNLGLKY